MASNTKWFFNRVRSLVWGFRGAFFQRIPHEKIEAGWFWLIAFMFASLAICGFDNFFQVGTKGQLSLYGLPGVLFDVPVILFAAWLIATIGRDSEKSLTLVSVFSVIAIPIKLLSLLILRLFEIQLDEITDSVGRFCIDHLDAIWFSLASGVAVVRLLEFRLLRGVAAFFLTGVVIGAPLALVSRGEYLWTYRFDEQEYELQAAQRNVLYGEDVFYLQAKLLESELAGVKAGVADDSNLYFVGVAGYSDQDVFMKEIRYVGDLFKKKFGTNGRTIELINNPKSVAQQPIASVTSLRASLKRIGEVMNRDKDVLFLYMTSHGSKDHRFSLDLGSMKFKELDPVTLRAMLDESGIKHRVVVISACYSGGFIEPLKDDNSLILTAAASDKKSFGCSNEADFTYFGKAYFEEALHKTESFIDAFDIAKNSIFLREEAEQKDHADPKVFVGKNIRATLSQVDSARMAQRNSLANQQQVLVSAKGDGEPYRKFVSLFNYPELLAHHRKNCLRSMDKYSPLTTVKKSPGAYGGLTPAAPQWIRVMTAWQVYLDGYCAMQSDPEIYQALNVEAWRERLPEEEVSKATDFYLSPLGRQLLAAGADVEVRVAAQLIDRQIAAADLAGAQLMAETGAAMADFQKALATQKSAMK